MDAYNTGNTKNKVIYAIVVFLILCMICLLVFIVFFDDNSDDVPAPAPADDPAPAPAPADDPPPAPAPEPGDEYNDGSSSDGSISDFEPDLDICGDSDNEYVAASECSDITNGKKCGGKDGKGGRWVNSKSKEKAVLCKWEDDKCVYHEDCGGNNDDKDDGGGDTPADAPNSGGAAGGSGGDIDDTECQLLRYQLKDALKEVNISSSTIGDVKGQEECQGVGRAKTCTRETERNRKTIRDELNGIISDINDELDKTCKDESNDTLAIINLIKKFNESFINEQVASDDYDYTFTNRKINFSDISWPFEDVESLEDLQNVLEDSEAFKNYEPYHNGNSRSSRKVPKPYDEHFVNFRSY